jgi:hypothetical protein
MTQPERRDVHDHRRAPGNTIAVNEQHEAGQRNQRIQRPPAIAHGRRPAIARVRREDRNGVDAEKDDQANDE